MYVAYYDGFDFDYCEFATDKYLTSHQHMHIIFHMQYTFIEHPHRMFKSLSYILSLYQRHPNKSSDPCVFYCSMHLLQLWCHKRLALSNNNHCNQHRHQNHHHLLEYLLNGNLDTATKTNHCFLDICTLS